MTNQAASYLSVLGLFVMGLGVLSYLGHDRPKPNRGEVFCAIASAIMLTWGLPQATNLHEFGKLVQAMLSYM